MRQTRMRQDCFQQCNLMIIRNQLNCIRYSEAITPIQPVKIQTDIIAFLIINNPASINVQTPNYYSQVYIPSVLNTGELIFIEFSLYFFLFFFSLSLYNHDSKHFLKKIIHKSPKQRKHCKIICSLISSSHSIFNLCKRKKN